MKSFTTTRPLLEKKRLQPSTGFVKLKEGSSGKISFTTQD